MPTQVARKPITARTFRTRGVYAAAFLSLLLGFAAGYGTWPTRLSESAAPAQDSVAPADTKTPPPHPGPQATDLKQMADQQAAPLLARIANDPKNPDLLLQLGAIYYVAQQYEDAVGWYSKASAADPRNVAARNKLAGSLYREGDSDGAIQQLNAALRIKPTDPDSLYNLGVIDLGGKGNVAGALASWQKLLQTNPQLSNDRKAAVLQLIANTMNFVDNSRAMGGVHRHAARKPQAE